MTYRLFCFTILPLSLQPFLLLADHQVDLSHCGGKRRFHPDLPFSFLFVQFFHRGKVKLPTRVYQTIDCFIQFPNQFFFLVFLWNLHYKLESMSFDSKKADDTLNEIS